jgi:hypothetical protein
MRDDEAHITAPAARLGADGSDGTVKFSARRRSVVLQEETGEAWRREEGRRGGELGFLWCVERD